MMGLLWLLLTVLASGTVCIHAFTPLNASGRREKAKEFYDRGMASLQAGQTDQGLAHLRAACRLNNQSALYWNDLGVTEMRHNQLVKAQQRFQSALALESGFTVAQRNLDDLLSFMKTTSPHLLRAHGQPKQHTVLDPLILSKKAFLALTPQQQQALHSQPFVVRRYFSKYRLQPFFTLEKLSDRYGKARVDYYPQNMLEEGVSPFLLSLGAALAQLTGPLEPYLQVDASMPGTYVQWNLDQAAFEGLLAMGNLTLPAALLDDQDMSCFPSTLNKNTFYFHTHWKMLLIGEQGAGMFLHQDILLTAAYQLQLTGAKRWAICDAQQSPYLYKPGVVDLFDADYEHLPLAKQAKCMEFVAEAGDLVYYPDSYWHQTRNLATPSIALSSSLITPESVIKLVDELLAECAGKKRIFMATQPLCENIKKCAVHWLKRHDGIGGDVEDL